MKQLILTTNSDLLEIKFHVIERIEDLEYNPDIKYVYVNENYNHNFINLSCYPNLDILKICDSKIQHIYIDECKLLTHLICVNIHCEIIDIHSHKNLKIFVANDMPYLKSVFIQNCESLHEIYCSSEMQFNVNLYGCTCLKQINIANTNLYDICILGCLCIKDLNIQNTNLKYLDLSDAILLKQLDISNTKIKHIRYK